MQVPQTQTHVSLDTQDLAASVAFYTAVLGQPPMLLKPDYARFDLSDPGLVLGLNALPAAGSSPGALNHLGIRLPARESLSEVRQRLQGAGIPLREELGVECCYAKLSRLWAVDPSGVRWELFAADEPVVEASSACGSSSCCAPGSCD
jgi:catechol 2,3-dioxygenase-like lactoylglutathione lyase family enzyme